MTRLAVRPPADGGGRTAVWWPWSIVAAAVGWNLASLRALTLGVAYLDDSTMHEQMVRFATARLRAGHLPLTSWFPFLGEGSPQFLHYQSLPAILTGLAGLAVGPDVAFRWSLYLLLSLWPVSVYLAARAFGAGRGGGRLGRDGSVPDERHGGRLRAGRLRVDGIRRLDATVGVVDAAARVGL